MSNGIEVDELYDRARRNRRIGLVILFITLIVVVASLLVDGGVPGATWLAMAPFAAVGAGFIARSLLFTARIRRGEREKTEEATA